MAFKLADLPYDHDALEPHVSAETLHLHHGKHHKGYVDKLNKPVDEAGIEQLSLEEVIQHSAGEPEGELGRQIDADFGGIEKFREAFKAAATGRFGSGWAWLVLDNGRLKVTSTSNGELPMTKGQQALLTCDVWEHAYYLDYKNDRGAFVDAFLDKLINWDFAAQQFALQGEGSSVAGRRYQEAQKDFAQSGDVRQGAEAAAEALEGAQGEDLEAARRSSASGPGA